MNLKLDSSFSNLNDKQKDSIFKLTHVSDNFIIPERFENDNISKGSSQHKIQLSVEFYNWLDDIEKKVDIIDDDVENNKTMLEFKALKNVCDKLHEEVSNCQSKIKRLSDLYVATSTKTNALHDACETLLKDQNSHSETSKAIEERLRYFMIVDNLSLKISFPNLKVSVENIRPILDQVDVSYKFLSSKPNYLESASYLSKLEELLSAILRKIYGFFLKEINSTFAQYSNKDEGSQNKSFTILYGRFRTQAIKVRPFIELISSRKDVWNIYNYTLGNCERLYIDKRQHLLTGVINVSIDDMLKKYSSDHCSFIRNGGAIMIRLCDDETNLYQQFFSNSDMHLLREMLIQLCSILYDAFRPSIIHINHLETLAELCCILKVELIEDFNDYDDSDNSPINRMCQMILEDVQERLVYRTHVYIKSQILGYTPSSGDLAYPEKLEMMITIAESMRNNISNTTNTNSIAQSVQQQDHIASNHNTNDSSAMIVLPQQSPKLTDTVAIASQAPGGDLLITPGPNMSLSPADLHGMWYPTVRRTLVCLSKLQRCLDTTTFQGLAQDCVAQCVQSLLAASNQIQSNKSPMDAQLFLIKHLLILREQVAPFNVEFTVKETSLTFNNIKNAAVGLITSRSQILALNRSNSLIKFLLETPEVIETVVDSRYQLDGQLKSSCDKFIEDCIGLLVGPINEFLNKMSNLEQLSQDSHTKVNIRDQAFAEVTHIQELISRCNRELSVSSCKSPASTNSKLPKFQLIRQNLRLYLANPDTESILLRPIKQAVLRAYRNFNSFLTLYYSEEDCHIISCPSEKQISLKMEVVSMDNNLTSK